MNTPTAELPRAPIVQPLNFLLVLADAGHVEFQGTPQLAHYNEGRLVGPDGTLYAHTTTCLIFDAK
jgi:hypothetical protein